MITINGQALDCAGITISQYLENHSYSLTRIAVEKNGEIVPKSQYDSVVLQDGDRLEVVSFVGGG